MGVCHLGCHIEPGGRREGEGKGRGGKGEMGRKEGGRVQGKVGRSRESREGGYHYFNSPALKGVGNTLIATCMLCGHGVPEVLVIVNVAITQPDKQSAPLHKGLFKKHWLQGRV